MESVPEPNVIDVQSLTRRYGALIAVDHLKFSVSSGGTFGLLGPNGAGKSTLIKMLTTLLPVTEGTARIAGFDLVKHPELVRKKIGYVSQMLSADGDLTGYENLLISAKIYGMQCADNRSGMRATMDTPTSFKAQLGVQPSLDDGFIQFAVAQISQAGDLQDVARARITSQHPGCAVAPHERTAPNTGRCLSRRAQ